MSPVIPNKMILRQTKDAFDRFSLPPQGRINRKFVMASGIDGGKFTTEENTDAIMNKMGYTNYIVDSNNNVLFNPIVIA